MNKKMTIFDTKAAVLINKSREAFMRKLLPKIIKNQSIHTAIDAGSGLGYFSNMLITLGLYVSAFDGRKENIKEAIRRYPNVRFSHHNIENPNTTIIGKHDMVFCAGLLYHLENPLLALRNLVGICKKVLIVETVVKPGNTLSAELVDENYDRNQGINYLALIPTEPFLIKCLYLAGFRYVYKTDEMPHYKDYHGSFFKRKSRTVLVASKRKLLISGLKVKKEPPSKSFLWDRFRFRDAVSTKSIFRLSYKVQSK